MERCESAWINNIEYAVELTGLLNEGAANNDGTWSSGTANWRFKHSKVFVVKDCKTAQEAVAFVVALGLKNNTVLKEWPCKVMAKDTWVQEVSAYGGDDLERARYVSPRNVKAAKAEMKAKTARFGM